MRVSIVSVFTGCFASIISGLCWALSVFGSSLPLESIWHLFIDQTGFFPFFPVFVLFCVRLFLFLSINNVRLCRISVRWELDPFPMTACPIMDLTFPHVPQHWALFCSQLCYHNEINSCTQRTEATEAVVWCGGQSTAFQKTADTPFSYCFTVK